MTPLQGFQQIFRKCGLFRSAQFFRDFLVQGILLLTVLLKIYKKKHYIEICRLFYPDSGQTGLLILKGVCCPMSNARAYNLGTEAVLSQTAENYSLFVCHTQFICAPSCCTSFNTICLRCLDFLPHADKPIHCVSQLIGLLSLLCFPLCHKENLDFSKMFISAWIFSSLFPVLDSKKEKKIYFKVRNDKVEE